MTLRRLISLMFAICVLAMQASPGKAAGPAGPKADVSQQAEGVLAIIVNRDNPVDDLSYSELRRVFLGERSHWPNGRRITLVMMEPGTPERKIMLREVYHMSEEELNRHFLRGVFTGEVFASPKMLASPVGVRKFVFNVPGAIGYVKLSDVDDSVKVIKVDGRAPDDKDYRVQLDPKPAK
jgi:ABC-type phosphate transport system substrate-binding protein